MEMIPIEWRAMWYYVVFFNMVTNILHGQILQAPVFFSRSKNETIRVVLMWQVALNPGDWCIPILPWSSVHRLDIFLFDLLVVACKLMKLCRCPVPIPINRINWMYKWFVLFQGQKQIHHADDTAVLKCGEGPVNPKQLHTFYRACCQGSIDDSSSCPNHSTTSGKARIQDAVESLDCKVFALHCESSANFIWKNRIESIHQNWEPLLQGTTQNTVSPSCPFHLIHPEISWDMFSVLHMARLTCWFCNQKTIRTCTGAQLSRVFWCARLRPVRLRSRRRLPYQDFFSTSKKSCPESQKTPHRQIFIIEYHRMIDQIYSKMRSL